MGRSPRHRRPHQLAEEGDRLERAAARSGRQPAGQAHPFRHAADHLAAGGRQHRVGHRQAVQPARRLGRREGAERQERLLTSDRIAIRAKVRANFALTYPESIAKVTLPAP